MLERTSSGRGGIERLSARRRRRSRRSLILLGVFVLVLAGAGVWLSWQGQVRVQTITLANQDPRLTPLVEAELAGTYFGVVPRNSIFFVPKRAIRAAILSVRLDIAAVSVVRESLTSISVVLHPRVPIAKWCGLSPTPDVEEYCYFFDAGGVLYAAADQGGVPLNSFRLYAPLAGRTEEPLGATIEHAYDLPAVFEFARQVGVLGTVVTSVIFREDEVDVLLVSGTRLTYLLGDEQSAFSNLTSAKSNLNLADGSIEYIDLRFSGKVYLKRKELPVEEE